MHDGGSGVLLLTSIGGYWVLERAETHKGSLRSVGRLLGAAVIVISLLGLLFRCGADGSRGGWKGICPFAGRGAQSPAP